MNRIIAQDLKDCKHYVLVLCRFAGALSNQKPFPPSDKQFLNFRGGKFSKSRGAAVDVPYSANKTPTRSATT
jgi:methionyl-tRNA synthetase